VVNFLLQSSGEWKKVFLRPQYEEGDPALNIGHIIDTLPELKHRRMSFTGTCKRKGWNYTCLNFTDWKIVSRRSLSGQGGAPSFIVSFISCWEARSMLLLQRDEL